jgi:serine/threonine protein kinase
VIYFACTGESLFEETRNSEEIESLIALATQKFGKSAETDNLADLLSRLLTESPAERILSHNALLHPFLC